MLHGNIILVININSTSPINLPRPDVYDFTSKWWPIARIHTQNNAKSESHSWSDIYDVTNEGTEATSNFNRNMHPRMFFWTRQNSKECLMEIDKKRSKKAHRTNSSFTLPKGPFKKYVTLFVTFLACELHVTLCQPHPRATRCIWKAPNPVADPIEDPIDPKLPRVDLTLFDQYAKLACETI